MCVLPPLFLRVFVKICKCCKRISLVKLANIAHVFTGVYLTCLSSYSCCFCHLFAGAGDRFCFGFNVLGSNRCLCASLHSVCYGATVHTGHRYRCEYCAHGDGWGGGSCDVRLPTNYKLQNWIFKIHIMQDVSLVILYL